MRLKKYFSLALTASFLLGFFWYYQNNQSSFAILKTIPIINVAFIGLLQLSMIFLNGIFIKTMLVPFEKKIGMFESFYVSMLTSIGNYFTPLRGGAGVRAIYLKKKFNLPYSTFLSTLYGNYIIIFLVSAAFGLLGVAGLGQVNGEISLKMGGIFLAVILGSLLVIKLKVSQLKAFGSGSVDSFLNKPYAILKKIIIGWEKISSDSSLLGKLLLITLCNFLLSSLIIYLEFKSIGVHLNAYNVVIFNALASLSLLISITPGSIGIRETILMLFSTTMNLTNTNILNTSIIDRGVTFFLLIISFLFLSIFKKTRKIKN